MSKISLNILSATSLKSRHLVLMNGGIKNTKHNISVRFFSDGPRPKYIPKKWEWIDWSHYPRSHRHIRVISDGLLIKNADYHVFMDDDSLTDIDKMVKNLDMQADRNMPTVWSGLPGRMLDIEYQKEIKKMHQLNIKDIDLSRIYIGYEIAVINSSLATKASCSIESKSVLKLCDFIDSKHVGTAWESPPDIQVCIMSALLNANTVPSGIDGCQQWPNYLNYSGLYKKGKLWHIHSIRKRNNTDPTEEAFCNILSKGGTRSIPDLISTVFNLEKGVSIKDIVNKTFSLDIYYQYWTFGSYQSKANRYHPSIRIMPDGVVDVKKYGDRILERYTPKWKKIKDGIEIQWDENFSSCYVCTSEQGIIGWDKLLDKTVGCSVLNYLQ